MEVSTPDQSPAHWRACVGKRMKPTTLSHQNYGGGEVNLVREIKVTIKRATFTTDATIQVQARAPVDLLLGTNVYTASLRFCILSIRC